MSIENLMDQLLDADENIGGIAVIADAGAIAYQTENWDLSAETGAILDAVKGGASSVTVLGLKYMIVENTPERVIGTNITGKGHMIICPFKGGVLATYILPQTGPRDALFNVQTFAAKLNGML